MKLADNFTMFPELFSDVRALIVVKLVNLPHKKDLIVYTEISCPQELRIYIHIHNCTIYIFIIVHYAFLHSISTSLGGITRIMQ